MKMPHSALASIIMSILTATSSSVALAANDGLPTDRPLVIAHRGSSGMLPEHTVEAYKLAVEQGADIIECDLAVTKDLKLICTHDAWLNATTDVHQHPEFEDRARTYFISSQLKQVTDYFTVDFTLEEIKTLRKVQARSYRDQSYNGQFAMASFEEYVAVAQNSSNPKTVGIYPETKIPDFFNRILEENGTSLEDLLLETLEKHGYNSKSSPCFLQSFDIRSLEYLSNHTQLRLVYLTPTTILDAQLERQSSYISGIGPSKQVIVQIDAATNRIVRTTDFIERAHKYGYVVHPYTFRNEDNSLAYDYGSDPYKEYETFIKLGVDGFFSDFPWSLSSYLDLKYVDEPECPTDGTGSSKSKQHMLLIVVTLIVMRFLQDTH